MKIERTILQPLEGGVAEQFDWMLHFDTTYALRPLEPWSETGGEAPETYPTGI